MATVPPNINYAQLSETFRQRLESLSGGANAEAAIAGPASGADKKISVA